MTSSTSPAAAGDHSGKKVCVMDASGRLGSALTRRLLLAGYTVHAALLHSHHELEVCDKSNKNLRVFHYSDPLDYHSIMDTLTGCSALFYTYELPADNPTYDETMGELEVRAAHNVLEACAHTPTIDKVVFTSSATAIIWRDCGHNDHDTPPTTPSSWSSVDERNWSDINFCKKFKLWHGVSKTMAEKTAWALAMDRGVNMVTINGGLLMCPDLSIKDPYLFGAEEMYRYGVFVTVDLEFLVDAHICVFEDPSAYGRYLCYNGVIDCMNDVQKLASQLSSSVATLEDDGGYQQRITNHKLSKLMLDFYSGAGDATECN